MRNLLIYILLLLTVGTFSAVANETVDEALSAKGVKHVIIENQRGNVQIQGTEGSQVSVSGELDEKSDGLLFEKDGSTVRIKVLMPNYYGSSWGGNSGSDLQISLPAQLAVSFSGVSSDIEIENLHNSADVKTVSGDIKAINLNNVELNSISGHIKAKNMTGKVVISTVSGDINDNQSSGRVFLHAMSGDIKSRSDAKELTIETVSGEIDANLAIVDDVDVTTVSGDAELSLTLGKGGKLKMSSVSGDLSAKFNGDVSANFKLKTNAGGVIRNGITEDKAERGKYARDAKLGFETGDGSGSVKANTVSGTITVTN